MKQKDSSAPSQLLSPHVEQGGGVKRKSKRASFVMAVADGHGLRTAIESQEADKSGVSRNSTPASATKIKARTTSFAAVLETVHEARNMESTLSPSEAPREGTSMGTGLGSLVPDNHDMPLTQDPFYRVDSVGLGATPTHALRTPVLEVRATSARRLFSNIVGSPNARSRGRSGTAVSAASAVSFGKCTEHTIESLESQTQQAPVGDGFVCAAARAGVSSAHGGDVSGLSGANRSGGPVGILKSSPRGANATAAENMRSELTGLSLDDMVAKVDGEDSGGSSSSDVLVLKGELSGMPKEQPCVGQLPLPTAEEIVDLENAADQQLERMLLEQAVTPLDGDDGASSTAGEEDIRLHAFTSLLLNQRRYLDALRELLADYLAPQPVPHLAQIAARLRQSLEAARQASGRWEQWDPKRWAAALAAHHSPHHAAAALRAALSGFAPDEDAIFTALRTVSTPQAWQQVLVGFRALAPHLHGGSLVKALRADLTYGELKVCKQILRSNGVDFYGGAGYRKEDEVETSEPDPMNDSTATNPDDTPSAIATGLYRVLSGEAGRPTRAKEWLNRVRSGDHWAEVLDTFSAEHAELHNGVLVDALVSALPSDEIEDCRGVLASRGIAWPRTGGAGGGAFGKEGAEPHAEQLQVIASGLYVSLAAQPPADEEVYRLLSGVPSNDAWRSVGETFSAQHAEFHDGDVVAALQAVLGPKELAKCAAILQCNGVDAYAAGRGAAAAARGEDFARHLADAFTASDDAAVLRLLNAMQSADDFHVADAAFQQLLASLGCGADLRSALRHYVAPCTWEYVEAALGSLGLDSASDGGSTSQLPPYRVQLAPQQIAARLLTCLSPAERALDHDGKSWRMPLASERALLQLFTLMTEGGVVEEVFDGVREAQGGVDASETLMAVCSAGTIARCEVMLSGCGKTLYDPDRNNPVTKARSDAAEQLYALLRSGLVGEEACDKLVTTFTSLGTREEAVRLFIQFAKQKPGFYDGVLADALGTVLPDVVFREIQDHLVGKLDLALKGPDEKDVAAWRRKHSDGALSLGNDHDGNDLYSKAASSLPASLALSCEDHLFFSLRSLQHPRPSLFPYPVVQESSLSPSVDDNGRRQSAATCYKATPVSSGIPKVRSMLTSLDCKRTESKVTPASAKASLEPVNTWAEAISQETVTFTALTRQAQDSNAFHPSSEHSSPSPAPPTQPAQPPPHVELYQALAATPTDDAAVLAIFERMGNVSEIKALVTSLGEANPDFHDGRYRDMLRNELSPVGLQKVEWFLNRYGLSLGDGDAPSSVQSQLEQDLALPQPPQSQHTPHVELYHALAATPTDDAAAFAVFERLGNMDEIRDMLRALMGAYPNFHGGNYLTMLRNELSPLGLSQLQEFLNTHSASLGSDIEPLDLLVSRHSLRTSTLPLHVQLHNALAATPTDEVAVLAVFERAGSRDAVQSMLTNLGNVYPDFHAGDHRNMLRNEMSPLGLAKLQVFWNMYGVATGEIEPNMKDTDGIPAVIQNIALQVDAALSSTPPDGEAVVQIFEAMATESVAEVFAAFPAVTSTEYLRLPKSRGLLNRKLRTCLVPKDLARCEAILVSNGHTLGEPRVVPYSAVVWEPAWALTEALKKVPADGGQVLEALGAVGPGDLQGVIDTFKEMNPDRYEGDLGMHLQSLLEEDIVKKAEAVANAANLSFHPAPHPILPKLIACISNANDNDGNRAEEFMTHLAEVNGKEDWELLSKSLTIHCTDVEGGDLRKIVALCFPKWALGACECLANDSGLSLGPDLEATANAYRIYAEVSSDRCDGAVVAKTIESILGQHQHLGVKEQLAVFLTVRDAFKDCYPHFHAGSLGDALRSTLDDAGITLCHEALLKIGIGLRA
eukprot:TRINITY_DN2585_c0_g1_i6.p1 TRINITY_DN2585_c0_g1~~TRINITY_DN2585_c0_g1_i6.p1  ORF type:complete len:1971 (+),score=366.53 TRINITY_DN2585_c0_g1_i6:322-5913(+)